MIERVALANFKAIGEKVDIPLAPLTLFVGENGTGKSSVIEAIALLAQSARPQGRTGLQPQGDLVDLGEDVRALYHSGSTTNEMFISMTIRIQPQHPSLTCWLAVREAPSAWLGDWRQGLETATGSIEVFKESAGGGYRLKARVRHEENVKEEYVGGSIETFLDERLYITASNNQTVDLQEWRDLAEEAASYLQPESTGLRIPRRLRYLSALRGAALMQRTPEGPSPAAGFRGANTIRLLARLQTTTDPRRRKLLEMLAQRFGLNEFRAGYGGAAPLVSKFEDPWTHAQLPIELAGFGSQQALPVIADIVDGGRGTTILLEEVEHSSHPKWVQKWGLTLAEAVKEGVQIIGTTHAPDLTLASALAVKQGIIKAKDLMVYEFRRGESGLAVSARGVDDQGRFQNGWLETFGEAEAQIMRDLIDGGEPPVSRRPRPRRSR